jgi:hypothetical protein
MDKVEARRCEKFAGSAQKNISNENRLRRNWKRDGEAGEVVRA